mmetsp:Transcript_10904/g.32684  ORF Transcript_10904/g.32684 Transcript_10904/m.32684 type:complete len:323 (-) Transcript_10904:435-1403(-)
MQQGIHAVLRPVRHPRRPLPHLNHQRERGRRLALQHALLGSPRPRLLITEGDTGDASDEVRQRGVFDEVLQELPVSCANQLHATLSDRSACKGLGMSANLVHNDDLRHVILNSLHHDAVLHGGVRDLHAAGPADGRVGHVSVAANLVAGVNNDHALVHLVAQHTCHLPDHCGLAHAGPSQEKDGLPVRLLHEVTDESHMSRHSAAHAACEPHHRALAVAQGGYAVQRTLHARSVVTAEGTHRLLCRLKILPGDLLVAEELATQHALESCLRAATQVQHHLEQVCTLGVVNQQAPNVRRKHLKEGVQIILHQHLTVLLRHQVP